MLKKMRFVVIEEDKDNDNTEEEWNEKVKKIAEELGGVVMDEDDLLDSENVEEDVAHSENKERDGCTEEEVGG